MLEIPLQPVPSQEVTVQLGGQACQIKVYQKATGLYCDLYVNNALIIGGVICQDRNRVVRSAYLGFDGDLAFADSQGVDDPDYTGLGSRFALVYFGADELAEAA